jgi:hypothetical protein
VAVTLGAPTVLDELLPAFDHRTMHGRPVAAPIDRVADALRTTPLAEARLARALFAARTLGRSLRRSSGLIADLGDGEDGFVRIADQPHEIVVGFAGRPWPGGDHEGMPRTADDWRAFVPTDSVKVAMSLRCATADYGTLLLTETRIACGPLAREPFERYWLLVRLGSGVVRQSLLRAIAREALR